MCFHCPRFVLSLKPSVTPTLPFCFVHLQVLLREAREKLGIDAVGRFNIAIPGPSGVGKSTLINAIMGPDLPDDQYAPVGVTETTMIPRAFNVPGTLLTLWDLPGWGTAAHPSETYFMDKMLYAFDAMLVVYAGRFPEGFKLIADGCKEFGVNFAVARNKSDADIEALTRKARGKPSMDYATAVATLRAEVQTELSKVTLALMFSQNFLISARSMEDGTASLDEDKLLGFVTSAAKTRNNGGPAAAGPAASSADGK